MFDLLAKSWSPAAAAAHFYGEYAKTAAQLPVLEAAKRRNAALDRLFYDIGNLSDAEFGLLVNEVNREGSILVVWPAGHADIGISKFASHEALRAESGKPLRRFGIAGVGSSDVGAASFARTLANHYREPVGAIVAGYGVADLMTEAAGGWFILGAANRMWRKLHIAERQKRDTSAGPAAAKGLDPDYARQAARELSGRSDAQTLLKLLLDEDRTIASIAGHSKGCLSIATALFSLNVFDRPEAIERAKAAHIVTAGAVVEFPHGFDNVAQYLGALDSFGALNSRQGVDHVSWPGAWHHLNTLIPAHMDFAEVLAGDPE